MEYVIGVDLGGTHLRGALIDERGTILSHVRTATLASEGPQAVIGRIADVIEQVRRDAPGPIKGVGVGAPGPVDPEAGMVIVAPNMPGWEHIPLCSLVQERVQLPVVIGNDANAAALAEWLFGAGKGLRNLIYVTISTGIGGGIIAEGRLLLGRRGLAAEVGHMVIQADGPRCGCGNLGCWEVMASGTALARMALDALMSSDRSSLLRDIAARGRLTAADVTTAAQKGDALARELLAQEGTYIGIGIVSLLHLFSPDIVILGGGVTNSGELIFAPMRQAIAERAIPGYRTVPIVTTSLGDEVGVLGAAALVLCAGGEAPTALAKG
ncbi:MAG: glucokinase [Herpetosiphonaceae bacterium]|nr:MAG: glucokinase [Herpetosiphonaceae bacterium]